ncbi:MAG: putative Thioredoxin-disulfide reductase [Pedosphaera sp.]|nr:putative Thioredoxin-disulfide reductase [Pedosphaera sp.]
MLKNQTAEIIIIGGGIAGLSAAIYLGRAERNAFVIDAGKSMARWEPDVENYLGFPEGIAGSELLRRGQEQASRYGVGIIRDEIVKAERKQDLFKLRGRTHSYAARRLLLANGIFHRPAEIDGVPECLGHSMFFCKDCDGFRVRGKRIAIYGRGNEAVEYALAMTFYSACVAIVTDGKRPRWDRQHAGWIKKYEIPVYQERIVAVGREGCEVRSLKFPKGLELEVDAVFTTRGDIYFNGLATSLGARVDAEGQVVVDLDMRTTVKGLYAAGCVTPANCQMIIAAGQGATAAQTINHDLFQESLATHSLQRYRGQQLQDLARSGASEDRKKILATNHASALDAPGLQAGSQWPTATKPVKSRKTYGKRREINRSGSSRGQGLQSMDAVRKVSRVHGRRRRSPAIG